MPLANIFHNCTMITIPTELVSTSRTFNHYTHNRSLNKVYGVISISNIFLIVVIKRGVCFMRSNKKVINTSKADSDVFPVNQRKHK